MGRKTDGAELMKFLFYVLLFLVSLYLLLVLLSPLLIQSDNRFLLGMGAVSYIFNVLMCHQLPERSFQLFGQYMPLCSRDIGLLIGVFAAFLISFASSRLPGILKSSSAAVLSIVPLAVDGVMQFLGVWESTNGVRLVTGLISGFFISYYAVHVFVGEPKCNRTALRGLLSVSPLLLILLAASIYVGGSYRTKSEILSKTKAINNVANIRVFYIAPRAFGSSIRSDVYVEGYNDTVLDDVRRIGKGGAYGVWVAVVSDGNDEGRHVFASGGGVNYFYDARSGELIGRFEH